MGLDVERFQTPPDDEFVCDVCFGVMEEPMCTPCDHHFCENCIRTSLSCQPSCPTCRESVRPAALKQSSRVVRNLIAKLTLQCNFQSYGCEEVVTVEGLAKHVKDCGFAPGMCENKGCPFSEGGQKTLCRKDLPAHQGECEWRLEKCAHECGVELPIKEKPEHESQCPMRHVPCPQGCGESVRAVDMPHHTEAECSMALVECDVEGCSFKDKKGATDKWDEHMASSVGSHMRLMAHAQAAHGRELVKLRKLVDAHQKTIAALESENLKLGSLVALFTPERTVMWVMDDFRAKSSRGERVHSPLLSFPSPVPSQRYHFKIRCHPNRVSPDTQQGCVGLYFMLQPGPEPDTLAWPITRPVTFRVVNQRGGDDKVKTINPISDQSDRAWFERHAPPVHDNTKCLGWGKFMSKEEVESGEWVRNDTLIVQVTLLSA